MSTFSACTVARRVELAAVRVLADSLRAAHHDVTLSVLFIDEPASELSSDEPFRRLDASVVGIDLQALHVAALHLSPAALVAAFKPTVLSHLLGEFAGPVVYLDPNSRLFAPLDRAIDALTAPVGLCPMAGMAGAGLSSAVLVGGPWFPGLSVVGPGAEAALLWWKKELRLGALGEAADRRGTPPDWVDLGPGYFAAVPLSDPGCGVGYWNAAERGLGRDRERYVVDGGPLVSFHFEGFDPTRPWLMAPEASARPPLLLSESPPLARLCAAYADDLVASGLASERARAYGWSTLPDGTPVSRRIREAVRTAVLAVEAGLTYELPPDPFGSPDGLDAFYDWLASPEPENERAPTMARFFFPLYLSRDDLKGTFPDVALVDEPRYREWAENHSPLEYRIPDPVFKGAFEQDRWPLRRPVRWTPPDLLQPGFLVAGYLRAELGIGDAARRALQVMSDAPLPHGAFDFQLTKSRREHDASVGSALRTDFDTNLLWLNADQLGYFTRLVGADFFDGRYTIGNWAWETEQLPVTMGEMSRFVDEIWVPSDFTANAVRPVVSVPVHTFEHPVTTPVVDPTIDPGKLGVPDGFVFLFMFDFLSTLARKNPIGLIEAFCRAFRAGEGPKLVVKSINGSRFPDGAERIRLAIGDRPDIVLLDRYVSAAESAALLARADCYVSLHRSEGFGLTIAESMALGKPVVATRYSGNLSFMSDDTSFLVDAVRTRVGPGSPPYPPDGVWGEPDIDDAAEAMRRVYEDQAEADRRAKRGRELVLTEHSQARAARFLIERFAEIHRHKQKRAPFTSPVVEAVRQALAIPYWTGAMLGNPRPADP